MLVIKFFEINRPMRTILYNFKIVFTTEGIEPEGTIFY